LLIFDFEEKDKPFLTNQKSKINNRHSSINPPPSVILLYGTDFTR